MSLEELKKQKKQLYEIARKYDISNIYVFGSVARGENKESSDVDFLVEMEANASALGIGAFQFEVQELLKKQIDVVPTFAFSKIKDKKFIRSLRAEAIAL